MPKQYKEYSEFDRMEIFLLLQSFSNGTMSLDDGKRLITLLTSNNPYTYTKCPDIIFENLGTTDNGNVICGAYEHSKHAIVFNEYAISQRINHSILVSLGLKTTPENIKAASCMDLFDILSTIGHEMKHFIQIESLSKFDNVDKDKYDAYMKKLNSAFHLTTTLNNGSFSSMIENTINFVNANTINTYFSNLQSKDVYQFNYQCYLKDFKEKDARIAGFNFAYGMVMTMAKDPYAQVYPDVQNLLISTAEYMYNACKTKGKDFSVDTSSLDEFTNHLVDLFDKKAFSKEAINNLSVNELKDICTTLCLSEDTDKCNKLINDYKTDCPNFSGVLNIMTESLYPELKYEDISNINNNNLNK